MKLVRKGITTFVNAKVSDKTEKTPFNFTLRWFSPVSVLLAAAQHLIGVTKSLPKTSSSQPAPRGAQRCHHSSDGWSKRPTIRTLEEAIRSLQSRNSVISKSTSHCGTANLRIGNASHGARKIRYAEVAYHRAVTLNPTDAESYNNLVSVGIVKTVSARARSFQQSDNLDQKFLKAKYNQAVSLRRMGTSLFGICFPQLIKSSPGYSLAYDGLAVTLPKPEERRRRYLS